MLFTEKYRPSKREEIVGNKDEIDKIFTMVDLGKLTHMILEGPPGTGKTTVAFVIARKLFKEFFRSNFFELNASDERGIDVVRETIKQFAKTMPLGDIKFKIILLDEGDEMTPEAQNALRRIMERYSDICIFIFAVNNLEKLIDPIQSRCEKFHFSPLSVNDITERLASVFQQEMKLGAFPDNDLPTLQKIAEYSHGDMRKALNHLQVLLSSGKPLSVDLVETVRTVDYGKIIFDSLQKGRLLESKQYLQKALELGYTERYIIDLIHKIYIDAELSYDIKANAVFALAESDYRMTLGVNKILAMDALLFKLVKT